MRVFFTGFVSLIVVVGVEQAVGPFGTPWDGLFGMTVGVACLFWIGLTVG